MKELELRKWFDLHFAPSDFNGRFQLGYRKKKSSALLPLVTMEQKQMEVFLQDMYVRGDYDYYITANSVSGVKRKTDGLFAFHNIVIDVDCHVDFNEGFGMNHFLIEAFLWRFQRDSMLPPPTSIVKTGRGVQLWWAITPVHQKCKPYLDEVRAVYLEEIQDILNEYPDLDELSVDKTASCNDVGYFRLPCSYNTKVKKKVEIEMMDENAIYVLQDLVSSVKKWKQNKVKEEATVKEFSDQKFKNDFANHEVFVLKNVQTLAFFRIRQLISLRKSRDSAIKEETRNNLNFLVYNALLPAVGEVEAWEKLQAFNNGFKQPMSTKELQAVIVSAKEKGGYKYSNEKIIEFLSISPEEQEKIGLFSPKKKGVVRFSQHPSRDASRALSKEARDKSIQELSKSRMTQKAIALELGISLPTISKVLNTKEIKENQKNLAEKAITQGKTIAEIMEISGLSRSSIKRMRTPIAT